MPTTEPPSRLFLTNLDFRRIRHPAARSPRSITATQQTAARVRDARFADQRVSLQTEAPAPSLVVIAQSYYPAWKAHVDGRPARVWRANYAFQAIEVPAGRTGSRWPMKTNGCEPGPPSPCWVCWLARVFGWPVAAASQPCRWGFSIRFIESMNRV